MDEYSPRVILLDDHLVHGAPLMELIRTTEGASVVLLAAPERQEEVIRLIAEGDLEFVARVEDFVPLGGQPRGTALALGRALRIVLGEHRGPHAGRHCRNLSPRNQ